MTAIGFGQYCACFHNLENRMACVDALRDVLDLTHASPPMRGIVLMPPASAGYGAAKSAPADSGGLSPHPPGGSA
ncbi:hypothetical protein B7R77_08865 [Ralstonia solanacearum K60]|uniref:Uncharacterized protein n=1 Tax=Ralstonia solanacearum K60 TaxID=1091042 RepID=A0AAP7ZN19_RALSL